MQPEVHVTGRRPDGWIDKTMTIYSAPPASGQAIAANIVIARDALAEGETFRNYCNRQIDGFRTTLPHFEREEERPGRIREHDAFHIRFVWQSGAGLLRQQVFFIAASAETIVTYTTTAAAEDFAGHQEIFDAGLADLRLASNDG